MQALDSGVPIVFSELEKPQLMVVIDAEEEFDWEAPLNSNANNVYAMDSINLVQEIFDEYGICPCYVVDYPVAVNPRGFTPLKQYLMEDRCEIGAHLHPWVSPPIVEEVSLRNSYPGNLAKDLEFEKIKTLKSKIEVSFGITPKIYKAGRNGFGPHTVDILKELGFEIDLSYSPAFDHSSDGGPDYTYAHAKPFWHDEKKSILEIPLSGSFVGIAGRMLPQIYCISHRLRYLKIPGVLSRIGVVDRLLLSPEGYDCMDHVKLTRFLLNQGVRTFTWSFHSPAVMPGANPYVKTEKDLQVFLDSFRQYFDFFFEEIGGVSTTPGKLKKSIDDRRSNNI